MPGLDQASSCTPLWLEGYNINRYKKENQTNIESYQIYKAPLPQNLITNIKAFAKKQRIDLDTILHTAWGILMHRFSSIDNFPYGTADDLSGNLKKIQFKNLLRVIESDVSDQATVKEYLHQIDKQLTKTTTQSANINIRYLFIFKKNKTAKEKGSHTTIEPSIFPLLFYISETRLSQLHIYYNANLFTKKSIENLAQHFILALQAILTENNTPVVHLQLLTHNEKNKLLEDWCTPKYDFTLPSLDSCLSDLFAEHVKSNPYHLAVTYKTTAITYIELNDYSNRLCQLLLDKGIKKDDKIAVLMERTPSLLMTMLAIFKLGAIYIPINPKFPDDRIHYVLDDSEVELVIINNLERLSHQYHAKALVINEMWEELDLPAITHAPHLPSISKKDLAYIIYTSGTTGQPKGVMIKHESLNNFIRWYQVYLGITPDDRASQFASQGFDTFLCETVPYLASGASIHIIDDHEKLTPSLFMLWLVKEKITICDLPTAYAQILISMPWPKNNSVRMLKIGGEALARYPSQTLSFDVWNIYGPTEATIEATYNKIYEANIPPEQQKYHHVPPPIGKPIINSEMYVVDQHLQLAPIGVVGELLIGGLIISSGYLNRADLNQVKFIDNPFDAAKTSKLYRTGDLVRWLADGNLEYVGRVDNQVKIRGYRIELSEVESVVSQYPDVSEVVVLARENMTGQKTMVAYFVPNLEKTRYPYQERCLVALETAELVEAITEDISAAGVAITGLNKTLHIGHKVKLHLKLPGMNEPMWIQGHVIWQLNHRTGIEYEISPETKDILAKSIQYYLSSHNLKEILLSTSAKRSLQKALSKKLPEYMIPSVFVALPEFPLTFNAKIDTKALPIPQYHNYVTQNEYVAPQSKTEKILCDIWEDILKQKQISMTDSFFDIGGNSLFVAQLSIRIMNKFKILLPTKILFDLPYIPIQAEYIDSKGKHYNLKSTIQDEIEHDLRLNENISPHKKLSPSLSYPRNVLLTGAGGFLGIYMLNELLQNTNAKIYCFIRKGDFETAAKRLTTTAESFNLGKEISLTNRRIIAIASDISQDNFGLPADLYNSLANKIEMIYHCGAQVNTMAAYSHLRGSNVLGTLEVIKLATQKVDKPIHYISTLSSAYMLDNAGNLAEEFPDNNNHPPLVGGYALTKWVSERLLTQVKNRGLPVSIYRSGYISGHSKSGMVHLNDALLMLIKGCIQLGLAPDWDEKITILPVDFVSRAIVRISLHHPEKSRALHLDHPTGILWTDLIAWLNDYGYAIKICPINKWKKQLEKITTENILYPFLPNYLALSNKDKSPNVNVDKARSLLHEVGMEFPLIDDKLLGIYFDYLSYAGFLPHVQVQSEKIHSDPHDHK